MITGFFYDSMLKEGRLEKHIIKILRLLVISNIVYVVFYAIMIYSGVDIGRDSLIRMNLFSLKDWFQVVFLNAQIIASHLWYLPAVLYDLIVFAVISRVMLKSERWENLLIILAIILAFLYPMLSTYSMVLFKRKISQVYVQNFVMPGFPCILAGWEMRKNYKTFANITGRLLGCLYGLLWILQILEVKILDSRFNVSIPGGVNAYLMTFLVSIGTFIVAIKYSMTQGKKNKILDALVNIGKKHSTNIYIYHAMIYTILFKFFNMVGFRHLDDFILKGWEIPALTFAIGIVLSATVLIIKNKLGKVKE